MTIRHASYDVGWRRHTRQPDAAISAARGDELRPPSTRLMPG